MSKHTPGPWKIQRQNPSQTTGEWMISGKKPGYLAEVLDCGSGDVNANALLIAAAPDLLEALESLCSFESALAQEKWDSARAAIAKARGDA